MTLTVVLLVAFSIVLDVIGQLCFKIGLDRLPALALDAPAGVAAISPDASGFSGIVLLLIGSYGWSGHFPLSA